MTAVETTSAVEIIEALEFSTERVCEHPDADGAPAAWVCRFRCCGKSALMCEGHHRTWEIRVQSGVYSLFTFRCEFCGARRQDLAEVFDWFPLGAGS